MNVKSIVMILVLVLASAGCARFLGVDSKMEFGNSQAYNAWQVIDPGNLTKDQQACLAEAEAVNWTAPENAALVQRFSWIDPRSLSVRDKVLLGECMLAFKQAVVASDMSSS